MDYNYPGIEEVSTEEDLERYAEEVSSYSENLDFDIGVMELEGVSKGVTSGVFKDEWDGYTQILMDEELLGTDELGDKLYHEMVHSVQGNVLSNYEFTDLEKEYIQPIFEGQADHNSGEPVYFEGVMLYREFLGEEDPGKGLEQLSDSYAVTDASVLVERDGNEEKVKVPVTVGRDGSHHMSKQEVDMMFKKKYGYGLDLNLEEVDYVRSTCIDYREDDFDSQKMGGVLREVQRAVSRWQQKLVEEGLLE